MANIYTRTLVETTVAMSLIPKPAGVLANHNIRDLNADAQPKLFGQDWNDEAWAVCKSDMLIKGEDADNIILGDTFTKDGFDRASDRKTSYSCRRSNSTGSMRTEFLVGKALR